MSIPEDIDTPIDIEGLCKEVFEVNRGKSASLEDLKHQVLKLSRGRANPHLVAVCINALFEEENE